MRILRSFCIALGMYSILPVPKLSWKPQDMRYSLCFLPIVGLLIGLLGLGWFFLCQWLHIGTVLFACGLTALPLLLSGGLHFDGYCDTIDALSSRQPTAQKLKILQDPHIGTFAVLFAGLYLLLYTGCATQLSDNLPAVLLVLCSFVLSRSLGGFAAVVFPSAKPQGLLQTFQNSAQKYTAITINIAIFAVTSVAMCSIQWFISLFALGGALLTLLYIKRMCQRQFGGITGDIAGYLITLCELISLIGITFGSLLERAVF